MGAAHDALHPVSVVVGSDVVIAGVAAVCLGFIVLYLFVGVLFSILSYDMKLGFEKRLYLTVTWPQFLSSNRSAEEKQKAHEDEKARQDFIRAAIRSKRRGF